MRAREAGGPGWGAAGPPRLQPALYIYFYRVSYKAAGSGSAESLCIINKLFNTAPSEPRLRLHRVFLPVLSRRLGRARRNQPGARAVERRLRASRASPGTAKAGAQQGGPALRTLGGKEPLGAALEELQGARRSGARRRQVRRGAAGTASPLGLRPASWDEVWGGLKHIWGPVLLPPGPWFLDLLDCVLKQA